MAILYDSEDVWFVLTNLRGSVWIKVLPYCFGNVILAAIIWLFRSYGNVDLTFSAGSAEGILNVLVSFFVVTEVNMNYGRFWEARGHLGKLVSDCRKFSSRLKTHTARETHDKALEWKGMVKDRLCRMVKHVFYDLHSGRIGHVAFRGEKGIENPEAILEHRALVKGDDGILEEDQQLFFDKYDLSASVQAALMGNKDFLKNPLTEKQIIAYVGLLNAILGSVNNLNKFTMAPIPFPFVQMGRTLLLAWLYHLPFVFENGMSDDLLSVLPVFAMVFVITFAFMGLASVSIELSDPFGTDENDLNISRQEQSLLLNIKDDLEKDCSNMFNWTDRTGGVEPEIRGFVGHAHVSEGGYNV